MLTRKQKRMYRMLAKIANADKLDELAYRESIAIKLRICARTYLGPCNVAFGGRDCDGFQWHRVHSVRHLADLQAVCASYDASADGSWDYRVMHWTESTAYVPSHGRRFTSV